MVSCAGVLRGRFAAQAGVLSVPGVLTPVRLSSNLSEKYRSSVKYYN